MGLGLGGASGAPPGAMQGARAWHWVRDNLVALVARAGRVLLCVLLHLLLLLLLLLLRQLALLLPGAPQGLGSPRL